MPIKIIRQDITKIRCDAVVNPTDANYSHGGGVDADIHRAAGKKLYKACLELPPLSVGKAVITDGFSLPCKYVIHTVGPRWMGGEMGEEDSLRACYYESLTLAKERRCQSVAFPLIASGTFGFPKDKVLKIAVDVISDFLLDNEMLVYLIVFDKESYSISEKLFTDIKSFIDDSYVGMMPPIFGNARMSGATASCTNGVRRMGDDTSEARRESVCKRTDSSDSIEKMLKEMDKGFAETLFYYIDKKGITDVECYKRANVDKKTFSKIKCNKSYKPSKKTAVSFAIALRLSYEETDHLLNTVGMSLSRSSKFDIIIEYFITTGDYKDIYDVNETLWKFDQETLGV